MSQGHYVYITELSQIINSFDNRKYYKVYINPKIKGSTYWQDLSIESFIRFNNKRVNKSNKWFHVKDEQDWKFFIGSVGKYNLNIQEKFVTFDNVWDFYNYIGYDKKLKKLLGDIK